MRFNLLARVKRAARYQNRHSRVIRIQAPSMVLVTACDAIAHQSLPERT